MWTWVSRRPNLGTHQSWQLPACSQQQVPKLVVPCKIVDSCLDGCAALLLNWNDAEKFSMTSSGANDNPNLEDLPEQEQGTIRVLGV